MLAIAVHNADILININFQSTAELKTKKMLKEIVTKSNYTI